MIFFIQFTTDFLRINHYLESDNLKNVWEKIKHIASLLKFIIIYYLSQNKMPIMVYTRRRNTPLFVYIYIILFNTILHVVLHMM